MIMLTAEQKNTLNNDEDEFINSAIIEDHSERLKTRSVTFRLDSTVTDELQRQADQKEILLNVLVNKTQI